MGVVTSPLYEEALGRRAGPSESRLQAIQGKRGRSTGFIRCWSCHAAMLELAEDLCLLLIAQSGKLRMRPHVSPEGTMSRPRADKAAFLLIRQSHARCVERSVDGRLTR